MRSRLTFVLMLMTPLLGCSHRWWLAGYLRDDPTTYAHAEGQRAERLTSRALDKLACGHVAKAEELLREAIQVEPSYGPAHNNLGQLLYSRREFYLAAWEFEKAAREMPERAEPLYNLGQIFEETGRLPEAIGYYGQAYGLAPDDPVVLGAYVRARVRLGEMTPEIVALLDELILRETRPEWIDWAEERRVEILTAIEEPTTD